MAIASRFLTVALIVFLVLIVGGVALQIFLSRRKSKWPGLILPLLTALVYAPLYLLRTGDWRSTIALALIFPAMLWAHRSNFARWREGKEQTFRQFLFSRHEPQREEAGE